MRIVLQRVSSASVTVDDKTIDKIDQGLLLLLGIAPGDAQPDIDWLLNKVLTLKVFEDETGKLKKSVQDAQGSLLIVSQFTLYGDVRKGTTPSWSGAAAPAEAEKIYQQFVDTARQRGIYIATGQFQAHMQVSLVNDGPLTLVIDSPKNLASSSNG